MKDTRGFQFSLANANRKSIVLYKMSPGLRSQS